MWNLTACELLFADQQIIAVIDSGNEVGAHPNVITREETCILLVKV